MKRRLIPVLTGVLLLGLGIAVAVGSVGSDPMISLSYWENSYLPALVEGLRDRAAAGTEAVYQTALAQLDQAVRDQAGGFATARLETGQTLELGLGGSAVVQSGASALTAGALADVTAGRQVAAGEALTLSHRYIVLSAPALLRQTGAGSVAYQGEGTVRGADDPAGQSLPFADVTGDHWFYGAVAFVYEKGYFSGTGPAAFSPDAPMDRAMVATVLHRVAGSPGAEGGQSFSDVPAGQWYSAGVAWASGAGVVNGMGGGLYAPETPVTREQLVTMLYRFEKDYRKNAAPSTGDLSGFPDGGQVSDWARDAAGWAVGAGLLRGRNTGELDPRGTASRAEVATILQRFTAGA